MSGAPRRKPAPGCARMRVTVPGIGATMRSAAAGKRPTVSASPRRVVRCGLLALLAQQHRRTSSGEIERRERGRARREAGNFPLDETSVDLALNDLRMA